MKILQAFAGALALAFASGASAQNMQLNQAPVLHQSVTAQWLIDLFAARGFNAVMVESVNTHDTLEVTSPTGGVFYIAARSCEGDAPKQCSLVQIYALFDGSGVTLSHVNAMVRDAFVLSYAFLTDDGNGVLASKISLWGGVTEDNIVQEISAYFHDLDNLMSSIESGQLATVSFDADHDAAGLRKAKIDNLGRDGLVVNAVGPNAPKFRAGGFDAFSE